MKEGDPGFELQNNLVTGTQKVANNERNYNNERNNNVEHKAEVAGNNHLNVQFVLNNHESNNSDTERNNAAELYNHTERGAAFTVRDNNEGPHPLFLKPKKHWKVIAFALLVVVVAAVVTPLVLTFGKGSHIASPTRTFSVS